MALRTVTETRQLVKDFVKSLSFNGSAGIVTLGTANPFGSSSFYFSAWIKWGGNNGGFQTIFAKRDSYAANGLMFSMSINTDGILTVDTVTSFVNFSYTFPYGKWVHMVWVHDVAGAKDKLYINGELVSNQGIGTLGTKTTALISIGACESSAKDFFNGKIDEVLIGTGLPSADDVFKLSKKHIAPGTVWSYLKFDEGSGTTATDSSGNGNNGTIADATYSNEIVMSARPLAGQRFTVRDFGKSLFFDGVDDIVSIPTVTAQNDLTSISISAWIKPAAIGENNAGRIFGKASGLSNRWRLSMSSNNNIQFAAQWSGLGSWTSPANSIRYGAWNHVLVTYNMSSTGNDPVIYINGVQVAVTEVSTPTGSLAADTANAYIGNDSTTARTFLGLIDEVQLYNRILTLDEVKDIYYRGKILTGRVGHWKFDEGSGTTVNDATENANGTITGASYNTDVFMKARSYI